MLLGVNKSLLALAVVTGTLLTGCNEASPDQKSTNPTQTAVKPDAPVGPIVNDDLDQFGWSWSHNLSDKQFYEIKIPNQPWSAVNGNPHQLVIDGIYAAGDIQIRVKADSSKNRTASDVLVNPIIYTANSLVKRPKSPTNPVQNDSLNTFDWEFVSGFNTANEYEYSLTGGVSWNMVTNKPLLVGDVDIDVGHVQVRVKENTADGTVAGSVLISTQAFTTGVPVVITAPTLPKIFNESKIKTNGFGWKWVTDYDEPEYYEFTNDGGMTWQTVTSRPQHIGAKAYAKNKVGVRVKKNAIANQVNPAGQVLFATAVIEDFYVTRVVSMKTWNQAQDLKDDGNWSKADDDGCYIEYDGNGENPQFWAYTGFNDSADGVLDKLNPSFCSMPSWKLLSTTKMKAKTLVSSDYVPSTFKKYLISDDSSRSYWALESDAVTLEKISAGTENTTSYDYAIAVGSWAVPEIAKIIIESKTVNTDIQASVLLHDGKWKITSTEIVTAINDADTLSGNPLSPLLSDVQALETKTKTTFDALELEVTEYKERLGLLALYSTMLENDKSVDNSIKAKIKENTALANAEFIKFMALHTSFFTALKVTPALAALIQLADQNTVVNTTQDELIAATDGATIHAKSLELFAAASIIHDFINANMSITADLKTATDELPKEEHTALFSALNKLWVMFNDLPISADVDALNIAAEAGLKRASDAKYKVAAADAVIGTYFYKLDINGGYLPSSATYAQGWRCVMDNRDLVRQRIWTLLKDGLPNGADDLAFDASASGIASVMGAGGLVESTNATQLCGRSDWSLPSKVQLGSLRTGTISGTPTIDVNVFFRHLAFKPEYDISYYDGGATIFWYWTAEESSHKQIIYHYKTKNKSETDSGALKQGDEDKVVLGRLVSEIKLSYQLLDSAGDLTTDIKAAVCAYQSDTKLTWQLFDTDGLSVRQKYYADVLLEVSQANSNSLCGKDNWRVPESAELARLLPIDRTVFRFNDTKANSAYRCYVANDMNSGSSPRCYDMTSGEVKDAYSYSSYQYRLTASDK